MSFEDKFRISVHAVIADDEQKILQLQSTYGEKGWGLPGGALEHDETIHEALLRECKEELGTDIIILYMSGMYFHKVFQSHVCIFRCQLKTPGNIKLSNEHSAYRYFDLKELSSVQHQRVMDCLHFDGKVKSAKF